MKIKKKEEKKGRGFKSIPVTILSVNLRVDFDPEDPNSLLL